MVESYNKFKFIRLIKTSAIIVKMKYKMDVFKMLFKEIVSRYYKTNKNRMLRAIKYLKIVRIKQIYKKKFK